MGSVQSRWSRLGVGTNLGVVSVFLHEPVQTGDYIVLSSGELSAAALKRERFARADVLDAAVMAANRLISILLSNDSARPVRTFDKGPDHLLH